MATQISAFPFVDPTGLAALGILGTAVYIYSFDCESIIWANGPAQRFWGAGSVAELAVRSVAPRSAATSTRLNDLRKHFRNGENRTESWTLYPHGQPTSVLCRCSGVSLVGHPEAMLVELIHTDDGVFPPEEVRAAEALRHTPLNISMFANDGTIIFRNPSASALFASQTTPPPSLLSMIADRGQLDALLDEAEARGHAECTSALNLPDGPVHHIIASRVVDPATGERAWLLSHQDVSSLLDLRRRLAVSEYDILSLINLNFAPVVVMTEAGQLIQMNGAAAELLGDTPCVATLASLHESLKIRPEQPIHAELRRDNGQSIWISAVATPITFDGNECLAILLNDVDHIYRTASDLRTALANAEAVNAAQKRLLAIASHELRTPLAIIDSAAQRLAHSAEHLTAEAIEVTAGRIRTTVARLLALVQSTVEQARHDIPALACTRGTGDIGAVINRAIETARESNPAVHIVAEMDDLPPIDFDPVLMEQAFGNLFNNSIKFGSCLTKIKVCTNRDDLFLRIIISDNGPGIPPDEQECVFQPYTRGSNSLDIPGSGLGLSIVRQIISMHQGWIKLSSREGHVPGTEFIIGLPVSSRAKLADT